MTKNEMINELIKKVNRLNRIRNQWSLTTIEMDTGVSVDVAQAKRDALIANGVSVCDEIIALATSIKS